MLDEETSIVSALQREPEQTAFLLKFSGLTAIGLVAWDVLAGSILPDIVVKAVMLLLFLSYGAAVTYLVAKLMTSSRHWATGSVSAAARLAKPVTGRGESRSTSDLDALRRGPAEPMPASLEDEDDDSPLDEPSRPGTLSSPTAFNESYFLMQLQEQVKDARRQGREMCVAAVRVTLPGREMTPEVAQNVAYEMARMASGQARLMSQPLALSDSEFVLSLPTTGLDDTKQLVRDIVRAFGEYWCFFGIAAFPRHATDAANLVERAREACETSRQSGKRNQVEYSAA